VILIAADALRKMRTMSETYQESKYFEKMAYHDFLTGCKNRAAFYKEIFGIYQKKEFEGLWLVLLDINGLKEINDQFGHLEGDRAIKFAFQSIEKTVGKLGEAYRIGGDEFACIIKNDDGSKLRKEVETLQKEVAESVGGFHYDFSIAYGYDCYHEESDEIFDVFYKRVDQYMYRKKTAMKMVGD
ncbi:MAG: GGDEF domain-containing protein, partial [Clostridiales bacterium]|nr:GGDEF domain-containing protein [Clostridiales bacterium]